ncbi:Ger(x)C family spore germination protein [Halobacillus sp. H74]|uniref:Ger(x)C family spore germination protein n=1 Tax=Halobacillus sp. H74 TaxID=3457436 RepID=UPI003FCDB76A
MHHKILLSGLVLVLLAGCWDSKEIENVGIVTGLSLDVSEESSLSMVNQYVVPGKIPTQQESSNQEAPYQNIQINGESFFEIIRENSLESNRPPNYTHLKSILTSTRLFEKERVDQVIDLFIRDHEFRRTVPVFITGDSVEDIFSTEPTKELFPSIQIKELSENYLKNNKIPRNLSIGDMSQKISEETNFVIPGISLEDGFIKSSGAGVISAEESKYAGWIPSENIEGLRFIYNDVQGGYIDIVEDKIDQGPVVLEIKGSKTEYTTTLSGNTLTMKITIHISSVLGEDWGMERNVFKKGWKGKVEAAGNQVIKDKVEQVIQMAQKDFKIDFLDLSKRVKIQQPKYWKEHGKDWNNTFKDIDVSVEVKTKITDFGTQNFNSN